MTRSNRQSESKRPAGSMSGLVIAAIGLQLLLCSVSAAASNTIERIPGSVAHALRDIVDRQGAHDQLTQIFERGYRLCDISLAESDTARIDLCLPTAQLCGQWLFNLPPPCC